MSVGKLSPGVSGGSWMNFKLHRNLGPLTFVCLCFCSSLLSTRRLLCSVGSRGWGCSCQPATLIFPAGLAWPGGWILNPSPLFKISGALSKSLWVCWPSGSALGLSCALGRLPGPASWCAALPALSYGKKLLGKLMIYLPGQARCLTLVLSQMKNPMFSKYSKPFLLPFFLPLKMCCSQSLSPRYGALLLRDWLVWYKTDAKQCPVSVGFDFSHKQMFLIHGYRPLLHWSSLGEEAARTC